MVRHRLYRIIEVASEDDRWSRLYDVFMMITILVSLSPLVTKSTHPIFTWIDMITVAIFALDYLARWVTADFLLGRGKWSFLKYPFTPMAIIDLLSMLPSVTILSSGFKVLKLFRLLRTLRVLRVFKAVRYSKNLRIINNVIRRQKNSLGIVGVLAVGYIVVCALVIFNAEPDTFNTFFDAIYWATVSLTTVGYGDIYATSTIGKVITMISALFGIAIVALPAGIITAGYMEELNKSEEK